jgi:hypothetical protein
VNRNFGIKSFYLKIRGHVFAPEFGRKNVGARNFRHCIIKESIRRGSVSADFEDRLESAIFEDDVSKLYSIGKDMSGST